MKRGLIEQRSISSDDPWLPEYMNLIGTNPYGAVSVNSGEMKIAAVYKCFDSFGNDSLFATTQCER